MADDARTLLPSGGAELAGTNTDRVPGIGRGDPLGGSMKASRRGRHGCPWVRRSARARRLRELLGRAGRTIPLGLAALLVGDPAVLIVALVLGCGVAGVVGAVGAIRALGPMPPSSALRGHFPWIAGQLSPGLGRAGVL